MAGTTSRTTTSGIWPTTLQHWQVLESNVGTLVTKHFARGTGNNPLLWHLHPHPPHSHHNLHYIIRPGGWVDGSVFPWASKPQGSGGISSMPSLPSPTPTGTGSPTPQGTGSSVPGSPTGSSPVKTSSIAHTVDQTTPSCFADGAAWFSPTSWCNCGLDSTYTTLSTTSGPTEANCAYMTLPESGIHPIMTSAAPTIVPGTNGVPGCAAIVASGGTSAYCNCGGTVPWLPLFVLLWTDS